MARAIDIHPIIEEIQSSLEIPSYSEHDDGFDDGLKYVLDLIEKALTLTPANEAPPCYQPDGDGCSYQCYDGDDEPIDKCKECPLCYSDKQRHHAPPNEWVNRNVRLPEWQVDVLVLYDSGKIDINWVDSVGEFMYENIYGRVTHWMPLPAPPAGGS